MQGKTNVGKEILLQANKEGDKNAKYGLVIALRGGATLSNGGAMAPPVFFKNFIIYGYFAIF